MAEEGQSHLSNNHVIECPALDQYVPIGSFPEHPAQLSSRVSIRLWILPHLRLPFDMDMGTLRSINGFRENSYWPPLIAVRAQSNPTSNETNFVILLYLTSLRPNFLDKVY